MSTPSKAATPNAGAGRRPSVAPIKTGNTPTRTPLRVSTTTTSTTPTANNPAARTRSVRTGAGSGTATPPASARAAARKSVSMIAKTAMVDEAADHDAKAEAAAAMEDMRERLQKAELAAEEHMKQAAVLQARLDDATKEQSKLEESVHEQQERMEELENEKKESIRKRREIENIYETEQAAAIKERDEAQAREEELRNSLQRLKDAQKELRADDENRPNTSRTTSFRNSASPIPDGAHFAPPSSLERSDSRSSSRLILQKDKIIESLRLELAEAQIKIAELETMGGGRMQELEKALMDAKMTNARLMEDNESFQLLLAEKTMNGEFGSFLKAASTYGSRPTSRERTERPRASSLADELNFDLNSVSESEAAEPDPAEHRRLLADMSALRDQNKALSLYINNIISRLLQHKEFENILDKTPKEKPPPLTATTRPQPDPSTDANLDKDLPPPPPPKDSQPASFLQRATSVVRGRQSRSQPLEPTSAQYEQNVATTAGAVTEDPLTAPRIPLGRPQAGRVLSGGHRRANSEWTHAGVVNNMYRGPSPASGQVSPGFAPQRASTFFSSTTNPAAAARVPSGSGSSGFPERRESMQAPSSNRDSKIGSSRNSIVSEPDNNGSSTSPPHSMTSSSDKPSGAIMGGNKMRPLRLVQEADEEKEAQKKANRSSWMGWFNKGGAAPKTPTTEEPVIKE